MSLVFHDGTALVIGDALSITLNGNVTLRLTPAQVIPHDLDVDIAWYLYPSATIELIDPATTIQGAVTLRLTPGATIALGQDPSAPIVQQGAVTLRLTPSADFNVGEPNRPPIDLYADATLRLTPASPQSPGVMWTPRLVVTTTWMER